MNLSVVSGPLLRPVEEIIIYRFSTKDHGPLTADK